MAEGDSSKDGTANESVPSHFIRNIVVEDIRQSKNHGRVHTRFPPEPNGYLHIGHAKSICLNFGLAAEFGGKCNLRFDDTNPSKENVEYVDSIKEDVRWLGFAWDGEYYASDYFEQLYQFAMQLIHAGHGVCLRSQRRADAPVSWHADRAGQAQPLSRPLGGRESRSVSAHARRRSCRTAAARCAPRSIWRRPISICAIRSCTGCCARRHHRTGDSWCIYPTYDFAHGQSDSIEGITHSICTLEFEDHRPLYDWFLDRLGVHHPQQIEFARLNLTHTVLSKRKLLQLVQQKHVAGWDDPRMPTLAGIRRRGYTPEAIRNFCERIGVAKGNSTVDIAMLEHSLREDLNKRAPRVMAVLRPIKVVLENYPEGQVEELEAVNNPEDPSAGTRKVPFSRELYIEQDDFREEPPKGFFRLSPGVEVRLRYAYIIKCNEVVKDPDTGEARELRCTYDPETKSGSSQSKRKVKATIHWVSASHAVEAEVRLYDHLFAVEDPDDVPEGADWLANINPSSLERLVACRVEPCLASR